ncbi:M20/M25/M40 family metallo-hydrolase [bacterium]|nr:M20/M25/M40 family metallo-hydrolase [bacterium]MBU1650807.1 M20/M25/M40 family metallo-hydrolase [bacterium]
MLSRKFVICLLLTGLLFSAAAQGQLDYSLIKEVDLKSHIDFLCAPALEGRVAPGQGSEQAQRYIASLFEKYGLQELESAPQYLQNVPLRISRTDYESTKVLLDFGDKQISFSANDQFFFFPKGGEDYDICGEVILCGYGITAPEFNWDDYQQTDISGKFVLVIDGEPRLEDGSSRLNGERGNPTKYSRDVVKARIAQSKGALGLLIAASVKTDSAGIVEKFGNKAEKMFDPIVQLPGYESDFPVIYLNSDAAEEFVGGDAHYFEAYQYLLPNEPRLLKDHQRDPVTLTLKIRYKDIQDTATANVIGFLPGQTDNAVLVMAHHDHEGIKNGKLYPGADDNASGVAGLLGIAKATARSSGKPANSIIFLSSGAEEKGSLGANYFIQHPPYPLDKIITVINMDEIGRDGSPQFRAMFDPSISGEKDLLMVFYSGQTPAFAEIAKQLDQQDLNLLLEPVLTFHSSSDHVPFHAQQIPSMFLFTGFHSDYTSPRDVPEKIVYDKLLRVTRFATSLTWEIATTKKRPTFDTSITEVERKGTYGH